MPGRKNSPECNNIFFVILRQKGADFAFAKITKLEKKQGYFEAHSEFENFQAKSVIIACGVEHRKLGLKNEEELIGHGISYCALFDGAFYAGEDVVLIGDANTALQYALLLSSYCKSVHVVTLFDKFFGDEVLVNALKNKPNIKVTHNAKLIELVGKDQLEGLVFQKTDGEKMSLKTKALFVAIGQIPNNKVFADLVDLSKDGYIICDENMATKTQGLFVAGDCRVKKVRQLTTACADGAVAATSASNYLQTI